MCNDRDLDNREQENDERDDRAKKWDFEANDESDKDEETDLDIDIEKLK